MYCRDFNSVLCSWFVNCVQQNPPSNPPCKYVYLTDFFPYTDFPQTKDQPDDGSHCCAIFSSLNEVINIRHLLLEAQRRCFFFVCFFILLICTGVLSTWHANFKWKTDASVERPGKCLSEKIKEVTIFQVSGFNIKTYHTSYLSQVPFVWRSYILHTKILHSCG